MVSAIGAQVGRRNSDGKCHHRTAPLPVFVSVHVFGFCELVVLLSVHVLGKFLLPQKKEEKNQKVRIESRKQNKTKQNCSLVFSPFFVFSVCTQTQKKQRYGFLLFIFYY